MEQEKGVLTPAQVPELYPASSWSNLAFLLPLSSAPRLTTPESGLFCYSLESPLQGEQG